MAPVQQLMKGMKTMVPLGTDLADGVFKALP